MTIRIVVEPDEKQATCPKCKVVLLYVSFDTKLSTNLAGELGYFLECPCCENSFMVKKGI